MIDKKRLPPIIVGLLLVLCIGVLIFSTYKAIESKRNSARLGENFSRNLSAALEKKRWNQDMTNVRLRDLTNFEWDRVYIFTPYTPLERIYSALGYKWSEAEDTGIQQIDPHDLIVFSFQGKVVTHVKHPRNLGDFSVTIVQKQKGFNTDEAVFGLKMEDNGDWLVLYPVNH